MSSDSYHCLNHECTQGLSPPGEGVFHKVFLNTANRLYKKNHQVGLGGRKVTRFEGRVTLWARQLFILVNTLVIFDSHTRIKLDTQSMCETACDNFQLGWQGQLSFHINIR